MKAFLAFLLVPLSMVVYVVLSMRGAYQMWPLGNLAVMLFGLGLLGVMLWKAPSWWRWVLQAGGVALVGLFVWWIAVYSDYPDEVGGAEVGDVVLERLGAARLVDSRGEAFDLGERLGASPSTVLVFFRGPW